MDLDTLDILLADARERYKAEFDRYGQIFSRSGIYLAILTLYVNALARFLDKPPILKSNLLACLFYIGCGVLVLATFLTLSFTVMALWGRTVTFTLLPTDWIKYVETTEAWLRDPAVSTSIPGGIKLDRDLKDQMLRRFAEAIDLNYRTNEARFGWLHWASQLLAVGFVGLLLSAVGYSWPAVSPLDAGLGKTSAIQVDPATIHTYKVPVPNGQNVPVPGVQPGIQAPPSNHAGGPVPPTPTPPPPKPEPRAVRTVKDGTVRSGKILND